MLVQHNITSSGPLVSTRAKPLRARQRVCAPPRALTTGVGPTAPAMAEASPARSHIGHPLEQTGGCVYLDHNATTPIFPEVVQAMQPFLLHFGNPSSAHAYGAQARGGVDLARRQVADLVGASPEEIVFTSCGTESDNWAIWGAAMAARARGLPPGRLPHVVSSEIEHPAILECLKALAKQGLLTYTLVPVDAGGRVSPAAVDAACTPDTCLVTLMHSNNEVGTLQPVAEVAAAARARGVLVHSDAAQSIGKVEVDVRALGVDMLTLVGHKFGAPKGVAALYIRSGVRIANLLNGGGQEGGRRGGTENVVLTVGMGAAAALVTREGEARFGHQRDMRDRLERGLRAVLPEERLRINGPEDASLRLPNTLSISIKGLAAPSLLLQLRGSLAASAAAACHSSTGSSAGVSSVLAAMEVEPSFAVGTLRLSTGRHTTPEEVDQAVRLIAGAAARQGMQLRAGAVDASHPL